MSEIKHIIKIIFTLLPQNHLWTFLCHHHAVSMETHNLADGTRDCTPCWNLEVWGLWAKGHGILHVLWAAGHDPGPTFIIQPPPGSLVSLPESTPPIHHH